jgi:SAM-dependent methyltransferase
MTVTGERIVTREGGFNPTWQRHTANYLFAARFLPVPAGPAGTVLDLGCGTGHASHLLGDRRTVGVDFDQEALAGQSRPGVKADLRRLPFGDATLEAIVCLHAIEHVPDPERVVAECARSVQPGGRVLFATPNRLTFGRPDEIIDPYHDIEYDPEQLRALCAKGFGEVEVYGLFGSPRYMEFFQRERRRLDALLRLDPLRLRRFIPRRIKQRLYDWGLTRARRRVDPIAPLIELDDFSLEDTNLNESLDLLAVCTRTA